MKIAHLALYKATHFIWTGVCYTQVTKVFNSIRLNSIDVIRKSYQTRLFFRK